jgi:hypothetical protein
MGLVALLMSGCAASLESAPQPVAWGDTAVMGTATPGGLSDAEADALVARAIVAHEMRRP